MNFHKRLINNYDVTLIYFTPAYGIKCLKGSTGRVKETLPELYNVCVPECIYRGFCPEIESCGWCETEKSKEMLFKYRALSGN